MVAFALTLVFFLGTPQADLTFTAPPGWKVERQPSAIQIVGEARDTYSVSHLRIVIGPTLVQDGRPLELFRGVWAQSVQPLFTTQIDPMAFQRRLPGGLSLVHAGARMQSKDGSWWNVTSWLLRAKGRSVPILVVNDLISQQADAALAAFIESAAIPGAKPDTAPLYAAADLAGSWRQSSLVIASYVNRSGSYTGNASSQTQTALALEKGGSFRRSFFGSMRGGASVVNEGAAGTWSVEDDSLVLHRKDGKVERERIWFFGSTKDGPVLVLGGERYPDLVHPDTLGAEKYVPVSAR